MQTTSFPIFLLFHWHLKNETAEVGMTSRPPHLFTKNQDSQAKDALFQPENSFKLPPFHTCITLNFRTEKIVKISGADSHRFPLFYGNISQIFHNKHFFWKMVWIIFSNFLKFLEGFRGHASPWNFLDLFLTPFITLTWVSESFGQNIGQFHLPWMISLTNRWLLLLFLMPGNWAVFILLIRSTHEFRNLENTTVRDHTVS